MPDPPSLTPAVVPVDAAQESRGSEDSILSHSSQPTTLDFSTSDISGTNNIAATHDDLTPPTSAISSQVESQETGSPTLLERKQDASEIVKKEESTEPRHGSSSHSPPPGGASGTKRTASGELKRSSVNGVKDVISNSSGTSHSRTPSALSSGTNGNVVEVNAIHKGPVDGMETNASQLSQQLRTKLKYAMIKVQNGWQARSLDEVESLASQSPRSTVSGFHHFGNDQHLLSPRSALSRKYQRESSESDSSDSTVALEDRGLVNMLASPQVAGRRSLAPPVDLTPSSRRRPTPNSAYQSVHGPQPHSRPMHTARPPTSQRTPSQNAAMEADAVETLLFMASPSNSGYIPASQASQESTFRSTQPFASQTSPLRTQFSQASVTSPKRVAFSDDGSSDPSVDKAALIDRMLDELSDDSDDELEQAFQLAEKSKPVAAAVLT